MELLPEPIWNLRANIANIGRKLGEVPNCFKEVPTPMLPRGKDGKVDKHRGISIHSARYRNESGAYWNIHRSWMKQWAHPSLYGALELCECLDDAWALQADIEEALLSNKHLTGCLLE